jgi:hypothetical protein
VVLDYRRRLALLVQRALLAASEAPRPTSTTVPPHISKKMPRAIGELQSQLIGYPFYPPLYFA